MEKQPDVDLKLFNKFLNNQCSDEEREIVLLWLSEPRNKELAAEMMEMHWAVVNTTEGFNEIDVDDLLEDTRNRISQDSKPDFQQTPHALSIVEARYAGLDEENNFSQLSEKEEEPMHSVDYDATRQNIDKRNPRRVVLWPSLLAAAAVFVGLLIYFKEAPVPVSGSKPSADVIASTFLNAGDSIFNSAKTDLTVWLMDSSSVTLKPSSSMAVATLFNQQKREVILKGEGFFKIKPDKARPFRVFSFGIVTQVLGTSFTVRAPSEHEQIAVQVKTGRVSVRKNNSQLHSKGVKNEVVILTPNQQVTFDPMEKKLAPSLVEHPIPLQDEEGKMSKVYDEVEVGRVLADISEIYGIEIISDEKVKLTKITTLFKDEGLYERLDILTKAIGAKYKLTGTQVVVESSKR